MADAWKTMANFVVNLPDRPGELARFTERLCEADIGLFGIWGYAPGHDDPWISCVPESPEAFREFAANAGFEFDEARVLYLSDVNRTGALIETLKRIAGAGLNIDSIESVTSGDTFGCFIWADESNWDKLQSLLA